MTKIFWNSGKIVVGLLIFLCTMGCLSFQQNNNHFPSVNVPQENPEIGIQNWIDAVNGADVNRLYDLSPDEIKRQITLDQFKEENLNNTLLRSGHGFENFTIINRKQNGTYSQIFAQVWERLPPNQENPSGSEIPVYYTFALYYEHNEWKIWTI